MIRCPSCRGSKKVPKLGGMIGDCNTCKGKGEILESDRPAPIVIPVDEPKLDMAEQMKFVGSGSVTLEAQEVFGVPSTLVMEKLASNAPAISKLETTAKPSDDAKKRALYKRKKA